MGGTGYQLIDPAFAYHDSLLLFESLLSEVQAVHGHERLGRLGRLLD